MVVADTAPQVTDPTPAPRRRTGRRWLIGLAVAGILLILAAMAFKIFEPIQVLPRIRLGPGFSLTDQHGESVTSEDLKGSVVLYTFSYANCPEPCPSPEATLRDVQARLGEVDLGETELKLVTISFDPRRDTPEALATRAAATGADGEQWFYATAPEDRIQSIVGSGFKTWFEDRGDGTFSFDPTLVLQDGWGVVRGEYRYQTLASDTERILDHINILGEELRNSHGAAGLAYEAAHFFLCYP